MEVFLAAAQNAATFIPLPDFYLDCTGDYSIVLNLHLYCGRDLQTGFIKQLKSELEHLPSCVGFLPPVDQLEHTVISPNTISNFLEHPDSLSRNLADLKSPYSIDEKTILRAAAIRLELWLIYKFRVWTTPEPRGIMTFINHNSSALFYAIFVRSTRPDAHQNQAFRVLDAIVHPPLQTDSVEVAHLTVGNYIL